MNLFAPPELWCGVDCSHSYTFSSLVECVSQLGVADQVRTAAVPAFYSGQVRVFVTRPGRDLPILTAVINMPVPEMV